MYAGIVCSVHVDVCVYTICGSLHEIAFETYAREVCAVACFNMSIDTRKLALVLHTLIHSHPYIPSVHIHT